MIPSWMGWSTGRVKYFNTVDKPSEFYNDNR